MIFIAYLIKDQYAIWSGFKWNEPAVKNTMVNFIQQIDFQAGVCMGTSLEACTSGELQTDIN